MGFGISGLCAALIVTTGVAVALYRVFYQHRINKRLHDESLKRRKLPSPLTFSVFTVVAALIVFAATTAFMALTDFGAERVPAEYRNAVFDYQAFGPNQTAGYRSRFSIDENPGYTKTVEQKGDIRFTVFVRETAFDHYHPSFIIFAQYTGDKDILYYGIDTKYYAPDDRQMTGRGHAGPPYEGYICVIGTSSIQSRFELGVYLFDTAMKSEEWPPDQGAAVFETTTVLIPIGLPIY